jgi:hypothetical protein
LEVVEPDHAHADEYKRVYEGWKEALEKQL